MTLFMLIDASRISSPAVRCCGWLKAYPGRRVPQPLLCGVPGMNSHWEPCSPSTHGGGTRASTPGLAMPPGFCWWGALSLFWTGSVWAVPVPEQPSGDPGRDPPGGFGAAPVAGSDGQGAFAAWQCGGQRGQPGSSPGEEGWRWLCRQEELRHFSQAVLAQPSTGCTAHGSPSGPMDQLCRHQVQS